MNDDDLAKSLGRSVESRVRKLSPRSDMEDLLGRVGRRSSRQRRWLAAAAVGVLAFGGFAGYLIGQNSGDSGTRTVAARSDGLPAPEESSPGIEPADVNAARAGVTQAYLDAYSGSSSDRVRTSATQDGPALQTLRRDVLAEAQLHGLTTEQLAGTTVDVLSVTFIDETHAAVRFTITIPGHGDVLVDVVGYSVFEDGRWKVAARTACDLLSLNGLRRPCPPQ